MQNNARKVKHSATKIEHLASRPSRLYQRLEEALHTGTEVWFRMPGTRLVGIPIHLDAEYVEVVDVDVAEGFEDEDITDEPYQRTVWLIRLAEISAISYATDRWSKERFERLLHQSQSEQSSADRPSSEQTHTDSLHTDLSTLEQPNLDPSQREEESQEGG
ncbi:MAG: hypothetical protein AAF152_08830 [Cyanobacteria bacterium P01_A01_bin.114]